MRKHKRQVKTPQSESLRLRRLALTYAVRDSQSNTPVADAFRKVLA